MSSISPSGKGARVPPAELVKQAHQLEKLGVEDLKKTSGEFLTPPTHKRSFAMLDKGDSQINPTGPCNAAKRAFLKAA